MASSLSDILSAVQSGVIALNNMAAQVIGSFTRIDTRLRYIFCVKDYGAVGDGVTNDGAAINTAILALIAAGGGELYFPRGTYKTDGVQLLIDLSAITTRFLGRVRLLGTGSDSVISNTTSATSALKFLGRASNPEAYLSIQGLRFTGGAVVGSKGIELNICAFGSFRDVVSEAFDYGFDATDAEQIGFYSCYFRNNVHGMRFNGSSTVTDSNSFVFVDVAIANNSIYGINIVHPNAVTFIGGSIQYNGTVGGGVGQYGITITEAGTGYGTVNFTTVAFEGNGGAGDVISDQTTNPAVVTFTSCAFARTDLGTVGYGTNNINAKGTNANTLYLISGNTFRNFAPYAPNVARPTIALTNTAARIGDDGTNYFQSTLEKLIYPVLQIAGTDWVPYTPVIAATIGAFTTVSATGSYKGTGKTIYVSIIITITTNGAAAGAITATLPTAAAVTSAIPGKEVNLTAKTVMGNVGAASSTLTLHYYDATYPGANGNIIAVSGMYETL